jgi:phage/plasmid-associated DNA primase
MPFTNGVLDINTMKLLPHSHNNFLKWILLWLASNMVRSLL